MLATQVRVAATKAPATVATCYEQVDIPKAHERTATIPEQSWAIVPLLSVWARLRVHRCLAFITYCLKMFEGVLVLVTFD